MEIIGDFDNSSFSTIVKTQVSQIWMQETMEEKLIWTTLLRSLAAKGSGKINIFCSQKCHNFLMGGV